MKPHELHEIIFPRLFAALAGQPPLAAQAHHALDDLASLPVGAAGQVASNGDLSRRIEGRLNAAFEAAQEQVQREVPAELRVASVSLRKIVPTLKAMQDGRVHGVEASVHRSAFAALLAEVAPLVREVVLVVQRGQLAAGAPTDDCSCAASSSLHDTRRRRREPDARHAEHSLALAAGALS